VARSGDYLYPSRAVGCAAAKCQNSFALANGFEAIVAGEILDRLLLFGWLLSQRDPIESVVRDETAASLQASSLRSLWRAFRPARKRNAAGLPVKSVDGAPQYDQLLCAAEVFQRQRRCSPPDRLHDLLALVGRLHAIPSRDCGGIHNSMND